VNRAAVIGAAGPRRHGDAAGRRRGVAAALALVALAAVLLATRIPPLGHVLWNDEAYSAVVYIDRGRHAIFHETYIPNNHVLFNLLAAKTTALLGRSEPMYRLWGVVPAVAAVAIATALAWVHLGPWTAVVLAALAVTSPVHLELSVQARGYGLGFLAAALMLAGGFHLAGAARRSHGVGIGRARAVAPRGRQGERTAGGWLLVGTGGFVGIAALPVFVLPFLGQAIAAGLPRRWRGALATIAAVGTASLLFYRPLLAQIAAASGQEFGSRVAWTAVLIAPFSDLVMPWQGIVLPELPVRAALAATWLLLALGGWRVVREAGAAGLAALVAPIASTYLGFAALRLHVVPRFTSYLLFHVLILLAAGVVECAERLRAWRTIARAAAFGTAAILAIGAWRFALLSVDVARTPYESTGAAAQFALSTGIPDIVSNTPYVVAFTHYAGDRVRSLPPAELARLFCEGPAPLVFIHAPLFAEPVDVSCLRRRGARETVLPQRYGATEGWVHVWVLPGSRDSGGG
jgi:hypothetical protein